MGGDLLLLTEFKTSPRTTYHPVKGREEGRQAGRKQTRKLASEMAQQALTLLTKPDHLSSTPRILMVEGENQFLLVVL